MVDAFSGAVLSCKLLAPGKEWLRLYTWLGLDRIHQHTGLMRAVLMLCHDRLLLSCIGKSAHCLTLSCEM